MEWCGPGARAAGGGRRRQSAQPWRHVPVLSPGLGRAEPCRSPWGGRGRNLPSAPRRAPALQLRRACKRACARVCMRACVSVCAPVCARAPLGRRAPVRSALLSPRPLPFHRRPSPWPQRAHLPVPAVLIENLPGNLGGGRGREKEPRNGRRGERRGRLLTAWSLQHLLRHTSSLPGHRVGQSPGDLHPLGCPSCPLCTGRIMTLALRLRFCSPPHHRYYVSGW